MPVHILDDPTLSARARQFLTAEARRLRPTPTDQIRATATVVDEAGNSAPAPAEVVRAMVAYEERYGGLWYPVLGSGGMEHGLDGDPVARWTNHGWALASAIMGGAWTWGLDVLSDGRTAMQMPRAPYRIIDRSLEQRIESHALLASVRRWAHHQVRLRGEGDALPIDTRGFPPLVHAATGPAARWWADDNHAFHLHLRSWWQPQDTWLLRCFARRPGDLAHVTALLPSPEPAPDGDHDWCTLCSRFLADGESCRPSGEVHGRGAEPLQ